MAYSRDKNAARDDPTDVRNGSAGVSRRAPSGSRDDSDLLSRLIFSLHYHPRFDANAIAEEHRTWNSRHALPLEKFFRPHANDRRPNRRLRIGYVSPDFRNHVVGRNVMPLMRHHDRKRFEIVCYANHMKPDPMTGEFRSFADQWQDVAAMTDEQLAARIRDDRIDILVDLALHTTNNRALVFARKPAPVQATFAGYPATTGLTAID